MALRYCRKRGVKKDTFQPSLKPIPEEAALFNLEKFPRQYRSYETTKLGDEERFCHRAVNRHRIILNERAIWNEDLAIAEIPLFGYDMNFGGKSQLDARKQHNHWLNVLGQEVLDPGTKLFRFVFIDIFMHRILGIVITT